jgi:tetratricopeptide (TPR) repeat protein
MKTKLFLTILVIGSLSCKSQPNKDYLSLAVSQLELGNFENVVKYMDTLVALDEDNIDAYSFRGIAKGQLQDFKGALEDFNALIKLDPKNSTAYDHRGICKKNLDDYPGALADYNTAIVLNPANGEAYSNRAVVKYYFLSDTIGACDDWEKSVNAGYAKANQIRKGKCPSPCANYFVDNAMSQPDFYQFLKMNKLSLTIPDDYIKTDVIANCDMVYNFAIKHKKLDFEVRYLIVSIPEMRLKLKDATTTINLNEMYLSEIEVHTMNVSQGEPEIFRFETTDVENEFNTNIGLYSSFPANSEYSGNYKYVHMMVFHKDDVADCYITFLWNEQSVFDENIRDVFHAMKFVK